MNPVEQLVFGLHCLARAVRATGRAAVWRTALPAAAAQCAVVVAIAWAAHPVFSPVMAPLLRAVTGGDVIRYPGLFTRLAPLAALTQSPLWLVAGAPCAAAATAAFAVAFGAETPSRRAPATAIAAALATSPFAVAIAFVQWSLSAVATAQMSAMTQQLLPWLGGVAIGLACAACFLVVAEVVLGEAGALAAWAALPRLAAVGFLPGLAALAVLSLPLLPFAALEPAAAAGNLPGGPEAATVVALARAGVVTVAGLVGTGAAALAWLALAAGPEDAA